MNKRSFVIRTVFLGVTIGFITWNKGVTLLNNLLTEICRRSAEMRKAIRNENLPLNIFKKFNTSQSLSLTGENRFFF